MRSHDFNAHEGLKAGANVRRISQQAEALRDQDRQRIMERHAQARASDRRFSRRVLGVLVAVAVLAAIAAAWDQGKAKTAQLFHVETPAASSAVRA